MQRWNMASSGCYGSVVEIGREELKPFTDTRDWTLNIYVYIERVIQMSLSITEPRTVKDIW